MRSRRRACPNERSLLEGDFVGGRGLLLIEELEADSVIEGIVNFFFISVAVGETGGRAREAEEDKVGLAREAESIAGTEDDLTIGLLRSAVTSITLREGAGGETDAFDTAMGALDDDVGDAFGGSSCFFTVASCAGDRWCEMGGGITCFGVGSTMGARTADRIGFGACGTGGLGLAATAGEDDEDALLSGAPEAQREVMEVTLPPLPPRADRMSYLTSGSTGGGKTGSLGDLLGLGTSLGFSSLRIWGMCLTDSSEGGNTILSVLGTGAGPRKAASKAVDEG